MLYLSLFMMIPLACEGFLIYYESNNQISSRTLLLSSQIVENNVKKLDMLLGSIQKMTMAVNSDSTIQRLIRQSAIEIDKNDDISKLLSLRLIDLGQLYGGVFSTYIILDNKLVGKTSYYDLRERIDIDHDLYSQIRNHGDFQTFIHYGGSPIVAYQGGTVLLIGTSLINRETGKPYGIVVHEIRQAILENMMQADFGEHSYSLLLKSDGIMLANTIHSNFNNIFEVVREVTDQAIGTSLEIIEKKECFVLVKYLTNGWIMASVVYKHFLRENSRNIFNILLMVITIFFFIDIFVSRKLASYELAPIVKMNTYVDFVKEGDFSRSLYTIRHDEIGELTDNIRQMATRINTLINTIKEEQAQLRLHEYEVLQAQINPHFLYNTLDSINWLACKGDVKKTTEMISSVSTFFRIGLSNGENIIPLCDEIEHVRSYLTVEKIRFPDKFNYFIFQNQSLSKCFVPKLILQPVVENAIAHGIRPSDTMCMIMIHIEEDDNTICIQVVDNGVGMEISKLHEIQAVLANGQSEKNTDCYGLSNINDRIHILAGREYGLSIASERNNGTSVRIILPKDLRKKL
jgi:two-component system sensor histidine kinase YesM